MEHIERFLAAINRKTVDRLPTWLGLPDPASLRGLFEYFGADSLTQLKLKLDDDIFTVEVPYHSPAGNTIHTALNFDLPDPADFIDPDECKAAVNRVPEGFPIVGVLWSSHFQDACTALGIENALIKMMTEPEMFKEVNDSITEFYLHANEVFYSATKGKLHAILIGNDFASQTGLMFSPDAIREFVLPGTKKLIDQAKDYGLKVIYHSCGAISDIIPDLIEAGVDALHPFQTLASGMEPLQIRNRFGDMVSFCGGVDAQHLLVNGTPAQVREKVLELKTLFKTGLIISPSNEAILPDIPPSNIEALYNAIKLEEL